MIGLKINILLLFAGITTYSVVAAKFQCTEVGLFRYEEDINKFYSCEKVGAAAYLFPCPENRGFIKNADKTGCIPFNEWTCTENGLDTAPDCNDKNVYGLLHPHVNPNYYWACPHPQGKDAVKIKCENGRGFIRSNENYGCVPWAEWTCSDLKEK